MTYRPRSAPHPRRLAAPLGRRLAGALVAGLLLPVAAGAAGPPCRPCAGVRVADPSALLAELAAPPRLEGEARLYVVWEVDLSAPASAEMARAVEAAGGVPWLSLTFHTPAPLSEHLDDLEEELAAAVTAAQGTGSRAHVTVAWDPATSAEALPGAADHAFLLKRAAVAVTGANQEARVVAALPGDPAYLTALYREDVAAYLDGVAFRPAPRERLAEALETLATLDPGKPAVLDAVPFPADPFLALAIAAEEAAAGLAVTLFDLEGAPAPSLAPLKVLAREFHGDLSLDAYSEPHGAERAWVFVRGDDLGLRVIARAGEARELSLRFPDPHLRDPALVLPDTGEAIPLAGFRRSADGVEVLVSQPEPVVVLRLERVSAAELEGGLEEAVTVTGERGMPVEEILRHLQTFEDAQARALRHYRALNTTHLRFQFGGNQSVVATFEGPFFFRQGEGFDWAWERFYVNGIRWRRRTIPEIPLVQPEKAAALPLLIHLTKEYGYRLRGTQVVDGRDCWVVEFEPRDPEAGGRLYQGAVWIDRALFARVRTKALQLGLEGDVISNEETIEYRPVDASGEPGAWRAESFFLPLRTVRQQVYSILNGTTLVEQEARLSDLEINGADFAAQRQAALDSEVTMVRDTAGGLRYLIKDEETGERVVQEGFRTTRVLLGGGVFYDDALDYPLPLAGVNYFSFDFKETGAQVNAFFAGALVTGSLADPSLLGSRFDVGIDLFALAVAPNDTLYRDGREVPAEEVRSRPARLALTVGRQLGAYAKLNATYSLGYTDFNDTDSTGDGFVLPVDHFTQSVGLAGRYNRSGFRLRLDGSYHRRSEWEPWGLPGSGDFDPEARDYLLWRAAVSKNWYPGPFLRLGAELEYVSGEDLDRFSKYGFGFFSETRVHGYQSDRVRAERALATHWTYGFEVGEVFRLDLLGDVAWATDEDAGLDRELLAGVGIAGTVIGPWQTLVNVDLGTPVAGPDDGFVLFLTFLKLFD